MIFHEAVDRSSIKSKITTLVQNAEFLIDICKHEKKLDTLFSKYPAFGVLAK